MCQYICMHIMIMPRQRHLDGRFAKRLRACRRPFFFGENIDTSQCRYFDITRIGYRYIGIDLVNIDNEIQNISYHCLIYKQCFVLKWCCYVQLVLKRSLIFDVKNIDSIGFRPISMNIEYFYTARI